MTWRTAAALFLAAASAAAQGVDRPEPGSREAIAAATTQPRFLSPWVADVPDHPSIPSPSDHLGHIAGAPGELTRTEKIYAYYRALAAATDRVKVETIGKSEEGREILLVMVGDAEALRQAGRTREEMARLADPRTTDEAAMERIVATARPFYMLHGGLHSIETGSPEMLMELVYRLAVSDEPHIRDVRDKLIVLVNPVAEPDGRDRMVDWFYRHLKGKTDFDALPPVSPPYWGKYVVHDNNRDGVQRRLALTRATQDTFLKWHPIVVHDLHESIPLLCVWTGTGPYNVNVDPSANVEWHAIAFQEVATLTNFGMPGVWTWGFGEGWAHIYADSVAMNHNAIGKGYETFGNHSAETMERVIEPRERYAGRPVTEPDWFRTVPPPKKFKWSMRNNTNYMETGVLAALQYTARNAPDMMRHFWRRGANALERGRNDKPYAVVIPEQQEDRRRLATLVNLVRAHGIEVSRARSAFKVKEGEYPAGTFVVPMEQPYRGYALDLLTAQKYPIDKAPFDPYDVVSWSLPFSFGVEVKAVADEAVKRVPLDPVTAPVSYAGAVQGHSGVFLVRDQGQEALLAARVRLASFVVEVAEKPFSAGGRDYRAGSWILRDQPGVRAALEAAAAELDLDVNAVAAAPAVPHHPLDLPRLGLLQTWSDTESAGWARMILDDEKVPYTLVMDEDVRKGALRERFDVLLYPNTYDDLKGIVQGIDPRFSPLAFTRTAEYPSHGTPTTSPDITGGLTWAGVGHVEQFVRAGGLLVTLGGASTLPLDGGIARDVERAQVKDVSNPGSTLRATFRRPDHPLAFGYPKTIEALREDRPFYRVRRADRGRIVLQWGASADDAADDDDKKDEDKDEAAAKDEPKKDPLLVSGGIKGASEVEGKPAILDVPVGRGHVLAFDFDPIHRYMTLSDFRLVWNAVLNWNDLPATPAAQ